MTYFEWPARPDNVERIQLVTELHRKAAAMADQGARFDPGPIAARYPVAASAIRRLALADPRFRSMCEDFQLALTSLERFRAMPGGPDRPETRDYLLAVEDLSEEIRRFLEESGDLPRSQGY